MIRLATPGFDRLETTATLDISIGGTESNVAVALARLGRRATWLSALPANPLGRRIAATLRFHGVDTSRIIWEPSGRAGIYFLEPGTAPRPTRVIYDRAGSAVAGIDPDSISYALVSSSRLLHLTGITPALSEGCAESCRRLVEQAGRASVPLMFDVNYRGLLWSPEEAAAGIQFFLDHVDLLFCGAGDARTIWQLDGKPGACRPGTAGQVERSAGYRHVRTRRSDGREPLGRHLAPACAARRHHRSGRSR
ncbi:MAG: sugar kinase [Thermomicrobiales bacterium]